MNGGQAGPTFDAISATKLLTSYQSITSGTTFTIALSNNQTKIPISGSSGGIFANSVATLNTGSFIPSGIWDMNIFASKSALNTNVSLSYALFGYNGSTSTQIGGITSISNSEDITDNVIEEYILTLTFPYVDISSYTYLYIQLYYTTTTGANNHDLYLCYQSASAYSHIHTTFGINSLITGVTAINTSGYTNGATLTSTYYLELGQATATYPGIMTTTGQTFAGDKYFNGSVGVSGLLKIGNYSAAPTSGVTGSLYYDTTTSSMKYSDGTTWNSFSSGGGGGGTSVYNVVVSATGFTTGGSIIGSTGIFASTVSATGFTTGGSIIGSTGTFGNMTSLGIISIGGYSSGSGVTGIAGSMYYDTTTTTMKYSDGITWNSFSSGGGGGGGTSVYNEVVSATGFTTGGSIIGSTGTFTSTVTGALFNSTSDYRIKENVQNLNTELFNVNNLRPVNYHNTILNKQDIGFIAHEVQEQYPFLVTGEKDGPEKQSMNYIGLIGISVKEIQELKQTLKETIQNIISMKEHQIPVKKQTDESVNIMYYDDSDVKKYKYTTKSFVIDHPIDTSKYLVHGCLEGPESGVYYRGESEITNDESVEIELPEYVSKLAKKLSIQITGIYNGGKLKTYNVTRVNDNKFTVYGPNGEFYWIVHGSRAEIEVEPSKHNTIVKGSGPYKWI